MLASKSRLRKGFPRIRILVVSRQSEQIYAERALCAGGSGYWMRNSLAEELMHAIETVLAGEIYASSAITSLRCESWPVVGMVRCEECVPARLIITRLILQFLRSKGSFLRNFMRKAENKLTM